MGFGIEKLVGTGMEPLRIKCGEELSWIRGSWGVAAEDCSLKYLRIGAVQSCVLNRYIRGVAGYVCQRVQL
mgnify:CR=1 FL=1